MGEYLPYADQHSIQEAQVALHFQHDFDQQEITSARAGADLKDVLPRSAELRGGSVTVDLSNPGVQVQTGSERWPAAEWPSGRAFEDARTFIHALPVSSIPLPHLSFADDGEINFLWNQDGIHIDLGFYGTGTYSYFARGKADEGVLRR